MNAVLEAMKARRSCRQYQAKMPTDAEIDMVVKAGLQAASGMNSQPWAILVIKDPEERAKLSKVNAQIMGRDGDPFYGAPVVIVVLTNKKAPTYAYDGPLCIGNMLLAASSLGLGACWIHRAKETFEREDYKAMLRKLGLEDEFEGVGQVILGYPDENFKPRDIERRTGNVFVI